MEEFLTSTRKPIGASDLFKSAADPPSDRDNKHVPYNSKTDLAWILVLYLVGVVGSLIVAGVWFF